MCATWLVIHLDSEIFKIDFDSGRCVSESGCSRVTYHIIMSMATILAQLREKPVQQFLKMGQNGQNSNSSALILNAPFMRFYEKHFVPKNIYNL